MKYDSKDSRTDMYNPNFSPTVSSQGINESSNFMKNLPKWVEFVSWARWYPDLFYDLITPETGSIYIDLDERIFLRATARFLSSYGVFPRGFGKTLLEVMSMYHGAIFYPDINNAMSAQTKENAAKLLSEKHREVLKYYPLMANEIQKSSFVKDTAEVLFTSGGKVDILANHQNTKGARRHTLNIEESALLNNALFEDWVLTVPLYSNVY